MSSPGWRHVAAKVGSTALVAEVVIALEERVFILQCWKDGVRMAHGATAELPALAAAMHAWQSGTRVQPLTSTWPFLTTNGFAEAYERSLAEAIDYGWRRYHDNVAQAPRRVL